MALSGLYCPKCNGNLLDEATKCFHCHSPIGKKEWRQAINNEYLKAHEKDGFFTFIRWRTVFSLKLKAYRVKRFFRSLDTGFRRLFVRFI
jgi:hypothetical protein